MKKPPYIRDSKKFFGYFEVVVHDNHVIPCHNLATARLIKQKLASEHENKKSGSQQNN